LHTKTFYSTTTFFRMYIENKKLIVIILSLVVVVGIGTTLLLFLIQDDSRSNIEGIQQETRPIRIAFSSWVGNAPLVLAADRFFKKNNILVELILTENVTKAEEFIS
jgi:hypothetical protein